MSLWRIFFLLGFVLVAGSCGTAAVAAERDYQIPWCQKAGGQMEVRLSNGTRVDCLTHTYAVEFDFGHKWAESLGQALHYAAMTDHAPGIVLIIGDGGERYVKRLKKTIDTWRLPVRVWTVNE